MPHLAASDLVLLIIIDVPQKGLYGLYISTQLLICFSTNLREVQIMSFSPAIFTGSYNMRDIYFVCLDLLLF